MPSKVQKMRKKKKDYRALKKGNADVAPDAVVAEHAEADTDGESTGIDLQNLNFFYFLKIIFTILAFLFH